MTYTHTHINWKEVKRFEIEWKSEWMDEKTIKHKHLHSYARTESER